MTDPRSDPPYIAGERDMLDAWLDWHRETLAVKCDGLSDEQLRRRSVPPSTMSLLGLVRHMADVERIWFRRILADEDVPALHWSDASPDGDFDDVDTVTRGEAFATWRAEVAAARALTEGVPLDAIAKRQRHDHDVSLRWIMVHMIEEYARHNGHADLLRQKIDGMTGE